MTGRSWMRFRRAFGSAVVLALALGAQGLTIAQASTQKSIDVNSPEYKRGPTALHPVPCLPRPATVGDRENRSQSRWLDRSQGSC